MIVEVGMKLDKSIIFYHHMLVSHGLWLEFACVTHDVYYIKDAVNFEKMTENQIKNSCTRIRYVQSIMEQTITQNPDAKKLKQKENELIKKGYKKVFDTVKFDFQYKAKGMESRVQLQDIKDIGLLVYYDNPAYYDFPQEKQRLSLLKELNSYGFNFKKTDLGLDKLRTLYFGKEMFSKNQNG